MLSNLHVKNFALIDEADVSFEKGLNIITGETGAGKSIILGAIVAALGERLGKGIIKEGAESALCELTFTDVGDEARRICEEEQIDICDGTITLSRKIMQNGRSVTRINGETLSASTSRTIATALIDIYGQNEHQSLQDSKSQLAILDRYCGQEADKLLKEISHLLSEKKKSEEELAQFPSDDSVRAREVDRLEFEINEIEEAAIKEGEEEELKEQFRVLAGAKTIKENLFGAMEALRGDSGASDASGAAIKFLSHVSGLTGELSELYDRAADIDSMISDLYSDIERCSENIEDDEEKLAEVDKRLDLISHIKSRYGRDVAEIERFLEEDKKALRKLMDCDTEITELKNKISLLRTKAAEAAGKLSKLRHKQAKVLTECVCEALEDLGFNKVLFDIELTDTGTVRESGSDEICFMISLNPGAAPSPLARVASGGELSRIMLAIKSVMAHAEEIDSLVFDEIDTGISGRTAQKVAEKLAVISSATQVICITHLSQIAAMADEHILIEKSVEDDSTRVSVASLDDRGINKELTRMLSGTLVTRTVEEGAKELKELADLRKKELRLASRKL
ncbi:MAG: DNA repair protein RecN [Lachnospiraceae bacterium]|nr:DNA repair protein RecN [Lachnospiraceae bacterium]